MQFLVFLPSHNYAKILHTRTVSTTHEWIRGLASGLMPWRSGGWLRPARQELESTIHWEDFRDGMVRTECDSMRPFLKPIPQRSCVAFGRLFLWKCNKNIETFNIFWEKKKNSFELKKELAQFLPRMNSWVSLRICHEPAKTRIANPMPAVKC